jgi:thiamine transporter ThiT
MAEDIRDRLIKNLEEVDKSLRRSYIFQIILCLLFLYLFYNAATVADQTTPLNNQINDAKCVLEEFDKAKDFVMEFGKTRYPYYEDYNRKIGELANKVKQFDPKPSYDNPEQPRAKKVVLNEYSENLKNTLIAAKKSAQNNNLKVNLKDLIQFVRTLAPIDPNTRKQVKQFIKQKPKIVKQLQIRKYLHTNKLRGIHDLAVSKKFIDHSCLPKNPLPASFLGPFGSEEIHAIKISNRLAVLENIEKTLGTSDDIFKSDIENHQNELSTQLQKLQDANIAEINIPFAGQSMNTSFAFRIGPFAILLLQFLICSYFRHRYSLLKEIKSSFEATEESDRVKVDDLHLILWPWILNFPYYKSDKYQAERQRGALIIELLLSFFQYLPVLTIAAIAIRPIYFSTTGSLETPETQPADLAFMAIAAILLFTTYLQVRYSRKLDRQITALLGWKHADVKPLPALGVTPAVPWKVKFTLLLVAGIFSNFYFVSESLRIDLAILPVLLTLYAGYRFGRVRGIIFGIILAGFWNILNFFQMIEGYGFDPAFLTRPMSAGPLSFPHSNLLALVRLSLLGYLSGWIFDHIRVIIHEYHLSLSDQPSAEKLSAFMKVKKVVFTIAAAIVIVVANFEVYWFPSGLAMVLCSLFAFRLGPRSGAVAGVTAILISLITQMILGPMEIEVRMDYYGPGPMLSFGLIGYWSGYIGRVFKYQGEAIQRIGTKLSLWSTGRAQGNRRVPILSILLAIFAFIYFTLETVSPLNSYFRIVLLPFPTVIVMLLGTFYGPRKAAWLAGISLGTLLVITYSASVFDWRLGFEITENIFFGIKLFRWSCVSIGIYIVAAYWSGKILLIHNRQNQYWLAIAIFAAFQAASILRSGTFLSLASLFARVGDFRLDIFTNPAQLLEPWLTVLIFNFFLNLLRKE